MLLWLGEKIQKMLHGEGEVIRPMPKFTEKSLVDFEEMDNNEFIVSRQVVYHGCKLL